MAKAATKSTKKATKTTKRSARRKTSFASYISKVLKNASPKTKLTLSGKAVRILNSLVLDQFDRIATEAASLARSAKKSTLGSREAQAAIRVLFPAELAKHALAEGTRAVAKASA